MLKRISKKRLIRSVVYLSEKVDYWMKQIRKFDQKLTHPPKKYKVTEYNMEKNEDGTCEISYNCAEKGGNMNVSGDFFYCISMMECMNQMGYYTQEEKKDEKKDIQTKT